MNETHNRIVKEIAPINQRHHLKELCEAGERVLKVVEDMMPGVRYIALKDYQELNEAPIALRSAIQSTKAMLKAGKAQTR